jgi:alkanesulfonate monooxygenase SsuD/methylene tetrahydromethanopterin reductase-like flavin-dependent oxidoreductase (luciferase family)
LYAWKAITRKVGIHIPLLIGGNGERATLKLVAHYGDACNVFGDPATVAHKFAVLKEHCETAQRDYESIRRTISTVCVIADTDEQALSMVPEWLQAQPGGGLVGSPETIRTRLAAYEAVGVQELIISFLDASLESTRRFAKEFIA